MRELLHYRLLEKLGEGGMGEVHRALDTRLGREVALKLLPPALAADPERIARFEREARSLAALSHPNIVTIYQFERTPEACFLTMELVQGSTLGALIGPGGVSLDRFFAWSIAIVEALAAAHDRGILHRDLKPANVMLDDRERVKVLDFGLAKFEETFDDDAKTTDTMTRMGTLVGTVPYMSPEQIQGRPLDARSDLFSLGILFYEMATGRRPFEGASGLEILSAILKEAPRSLRELRPDWPERVQALIEKCLEKEPSARPQSALELRDDLAMLRKEARVGAARPSTPARVKPARLAPRSEAPGARWLRCDLGARLPTEGAASPLEALERLRKLRIDKLAELAEGLASAWRTGADGAPLDLVALLEPCGVEAYKRLRPLFDAIGERAREEGWRLPVLLPGVELGLGEASSVRLVLLFGASTSVPEIEALVRELVEPPFFDARGRPKPLGSSLHQTLRRIQRFCRPASGARSVNYVALVGLEPSFERIEPGLREELAPGTAHQRSRRPWHGWICGEEPGLDLEDRLRAWAPEPAGGEVDWPLLRSSTAKQPSFCWLKAELPDVEGIRLALMDPQSRLRPRKSAPAAPAHPWLRRIRLVKTDFFEALDLRLSHGLTTLIGGRGSGKSTVIECLRFALDRARATDFQEHEGSVLEGINAFRANRKKSRDFGETPGIFLPGHELRLELTVAGQDYELVLSGEGPPRVFLPGSTEPAALDARALIAPRILSQGQIAQIARDPAAQRRELDALLPADETRAFEERRAALLEELRRIQALREQLAARRASLPMRRTEQKTVEDQIAWLEQGGSQEILGDFHALQRQKLWLEDLTGVLGGLREAVDARAAEAERALGALTVAPEGPGRAWLEATLKKSGKSLRELASALRKQARQVLALETVLGEERGVHWEPAFRDAALRYAELRREMSEKGLDFGQHERLLAQRSLLEREIAELEGLEARLTETLAAGRGARSRLVELRLERLERRRERAKALEAQNADIRMEVRAFADRKGLLAQRERWFAGTGFREQDWELLVEFVYGAEPVAERLLEVVDALRTDVLATRRLGAALTAAQSEVAGRLGAERASRLSRHFYNALLQGDRIRLDEMELYLPEDQVEARARAADGSFKPITQGSIGQRGTAILSLLLSSGDQPLIIDQPEDDLDNQYVYTAVVRLLRRQKFVRQLIIATHNANIPVNGDAELIIALGVQSGERLGCVLASGSIDRPEVKAQVSSIMEGSAEAFRLRQERYGY